jgi:hypothetical protein
MGIRGELFSTKVGLQNRTYFFNVKENRMGDLYLNIVESKNKDSGGFERQSVILFAEDLSEFLKGFDESLRVLEKAVKEKRRAGSREDRLRKEAPQRENSEALPHGKKRYAGKSSGTAPRPVSHTKAKPETGHRPRKVVVRKRDRSE